MTPLGVWEMPSSADGLRETAGTGPRDWAAGLGLGALDGPGEKSAEGVSEGRAPSSVPTAGDGLAVLNWHDSRGWGWVSARKHSAEEGERGLGLELDGRDDAARGVEDDALSAWTI